MLSPVAADISIQGMVRTLPTAFKGGYMPSMQIIDELDRCKTALQVVAEMQSGGLATLLDLLIENLDVHFISSLPVIPGTAYKAWVDSTPVQMVWGVD